MAKRFVAPNLDNATPTSLLDEMGKLSLMENQIKKLRAYYKEAYYARSGIRMTIDGDYEHSELGQDQNIVYKSIPETGVIKEGEMFIAITKRSEPSRFDQTAFAEYDSETFEKFKRAKPQLTTKFELRAGVINPVVNDLIEQMKKELDLE